MYAQRFWQPRCHRCVEETATNERNGFIAPTYEPDLSFVYDIVLLISRDRESGERSLIG
jgi:hypothetical protein